MSFGIHFGELVLLHRGEQGLSQAALAIRAFDDESRKSRISELETGKIANPKQEIVDGLVVALGLSDEDVSACRRKGREKTGTLSFEQHERNVRERVAEIEAKLADATTDRELLQRQADEARRRLSDLEADYARTKADLAEARALLDRYDNQFEREKVEAARRALDRGDRTLADALFAEIQASAQPTIEAAAEAAYERGKLAEDDIRWQDADQHYGEAARLSPTYEHLLKAGMFADRCGDYRRGGRIKEQLVELAENEFGPGDTRTAVALNNLARSYRAQGRYTEAEPLYRRALEINEKALRLNHPSIGIGVGNLAGLLIDTGRIEEAKPLRERELKIMEIAHGPNHPHVAIAANNLASLLNDTKRPGEAEPLYRRALEIGETTLGPDHPTIAIQLNNLAKLLINTNRPEEAEPLYERAVAVFRKALGDDHPNTQKVVANYEVFKAGRGGS